MAALDGISGAYVDWSDSKGLNEWERKALELAENEASLDRRRLFYDSAVVLNLDVIANINSDSIPLEYHS